MKGAKLFNLISFLFLITMPWVFAQSVASSVMLSIDSSVNLTLSYRSIPTLVNFSHFFAKFCANDLKVVRPTIVDQVLIRLKCQLQNNSLC